MIPMTVVFSERQEVQAKSITELLFDFIILVIGVLPVFKKPTGITYYTLDNQHGFLSGIPPPGLLFFGMFEIMSIGISQCVDRQAIKVISAFSWLWPWLSCPFPVLVPLLPPC
jgi:hypothetical protein